MSITRVYGPELQKEFYAELHELSKCLRYSWLKEDSRESEDASASICVKVAKERLESLKTNATSFPKAFVAAQAIETLGQESCRCRRSLFALCLKNYYEPFFSTKSVV